MAEFKVTEKNEGVRLTLIMAGSIDEDVQFPQIQGTPQEIVIDLNKVTAINSVGIREWLNWIKPLSEKAQITLMNCPKPLVFQLNMVEGFLPKNAHVTSFFVPYFCEKCDREENVLYTKGKDYEAGAGNYSLSFDLKATGLCAEADCEMEMDATEAKYFQFLKRLP